MDNATIDGLSRRMADTYNGSKLPVKFLTASGWGTLLNLGYFGWVQVQVRRYRNHTQQANQGLSTESPLNTTSGAFQLESSTPTNLLQLFSFFMAGENCESFIGDLEERFGMILKARGRRSATLWFWRQVIQSLFPLAFAALRRVSGFERLIGYYWRKRL
jgi:hypothetical protein